MKYKQSFSSNKNVIYMCIAIVIAIFIFYRFALTPSQNNKTPIKTQKQNTMSTQTNSQGAVTVKVTPENVSEDKKFWQFNVVLDIHTGSLDEDLVKIAELIDERGNKKLPLSWNGASPGGHHREGVIEFSAFQQSPKSVTLILHNVGGIDERKFKWDTK
jgi:hypothetical protein